jgi:hypothetical protein
MSTFTPGPWKLMEKFEDSAFVYGEAEIHGRTRYPLMDIEILDEETRANARLVSSAPTLHAAVLEAIKLLAGYDFLDDKANAVLVQLREALAASEGRVIA